jgi:hypothetical protein
MIATLSDRADEANAEQDDAEQRDQRALAVRRREQAGDLPLVEDALVASASVG